MAGSSPVPSPLQGTTLAAGLKAGVVVGRFNEEVTRRLLEGALGELERMGARPADVEVVWVPGAFEIPQAARALAKRGGIDLLVCLGAIVRGATPHFDFLSAEVTGALGRLRDETLLPVGLGVLTTNDLAQAIDRAGGKSGNKGAEAARTAVEMATLLKRLGR